MCGQFGIIVLCCCMGTKTTLYSHTSVVKNHGSRNAAKIIKRMDNGIEKAFQVLPPVSNNIGCAAITHTRTKQIYLYFLTGQFYRSFSPVDLECLTRSKPQWNKNFIFLALCLGFMNRRSDGRLAARVTKFFYEPVVNPPCCVTLLLYTLRSICIEAVLNELLYFWRYDRGFSLVGFPIPWNCVAHPIFLDCVSGNSQNFSCCTLTGYSFKLQRAD